MILLTSHCQCQDKVLESLSNPSCLDTMVLLPVCTPGRGDHCSELRMHFANNYFLCFCLFISRPNLSWGPILTPAAADEGHPDVVRVDSRHWVASPCRAL